MPWVVTLTILVASAFLMDMSFTMITPFLPVYLSSALGAKASEVDMWSGAVFAVTFFVSGLLGPVWGRSTFRLVRLSGSDCCLRPDPFSSYCVLELWQKEVGKFGGVR